MNAQSTLLQNSNKAATTYMILVVLIAWLGLIMQFYITLSGYATGRTLPGVLVELVSFFTIICNFLVAISLTMALLKPGGYFSRNTVLSAITLYIIIVGLVYNINLRGLVALHGAAWWVNEVMHVIIPILYTIFWLAIVPKNGLTWKTALPWLWVPLFYLIYILIRGAICGLYPYPFMNAGKFGYAHVAIGCFVVMLAFLLVSQLLIFIARLAVKRQ